MISRSIFAVDLPSAIPQIGSTSVCTYLSGSLLSCATANIPNHRRRAEKALREQSKLFPCCNLTRKRKRTRPCKDCPTSSLHMILRVAPDACLITLDHHRGGNCEPVDWIVELHLTGLWSSEEKNNVRKQFSSCMQLKGSLRLGLFAFAQHRSASSCKTPKTAIRYQYRAGR